MNTRLCDAVAGALSPFSACEESNDGARVPTHCMYPSFTNVHVYVVKVGDGFRVHDGAGAFHAAWEHGREIPLITRFLNREAARYHLEMTDATLVADCPDEQWLASAILTVANASANAANAAVAHFTAAAERDLVARIYDRLRDTTHFPQIAMEYVSRGRSGKEYRYDLAVLGPSPGAGSPLALINAVSPHPASISAKYVSFADEGSRRATKLAVHDRPLANDDLALLQQVAEIVPFSSINEGLERALR